MMRAEPITCNAVDYPMDGILNVDGLIWVDAVNVTVQ